MMMTTTNLLRLVAAGCALLLTVDIVRAADDASRWDGDARSAARLIAGSQPENAKILRAGIEIRIKDGWHTYWRYPGDAGVPPQFDFKASTNLKEARVLYPAPQRLSEDGGTAIGYTGDIILPLQVVPQDAGKPVALHLKLNYAVCEKLCVPADATVDIQLGAGRSGSQDSVLAAAEARVPRKVALREGQGLAVRAAWRDDTAAKPRVLVDVAAPAGAPILFAEGPTPQWALPVPEIVAGAPPGVTRFAFELDGAPPDTAYAGALLTLTAVSAQDAIEVSFRLD